MIIIILLKHWLVNNYYKWCQIQFLFGLIGEIIKKRIRRILELGICLFKRQADNWKIPSPLHLKRVSRQNVQRLWIKFLLLCFVVFFFCWHLLNAFNLQLLHYFAILECVVSYLADFPINLWTFCVDNLIFADDISFVGSWIRIRFFFVSRRHKTFVDRKYLNANSGGNWDWNEISGWNFLNIVNCLWFQ